MVKRFVCHIVLRNMVLDLVELAAVQDQNCHRILMLKVVSIQIKIPDHMAENSHCPFSDVGAQSLDIQRDRNARGDLEIPSVLFNRRHMVKIVSVFPGTQRDTERIRNGE